MIRMMSALQKTMDSKQLNVCFITEQIPQMNLHV